MLAKAYFIRSLSLCAVCAVAVLLISGCAATGTAYTEAKSTIPSLEVGKARLYFMRESSFINSIIAARIHANGVRVVELNMSGFAYADLPAGEILIMIDDLLNPGESRQMINIESGKTYYFLVANNSSNVMAGAIGGFIGAVSEGGGRFAFYRISEEMALEQLKIKKLSGTSPP